MSNYELTIIMPVFNKINFTLSALKDLSHLDQSKIEIIVVDNASSDNTHKELLELQPKMSNLQVINNNENLGFGCAINKAYQKSTGKHIMVLNNDIRVKDRLNDWVDILLEKCDDNNLVGPTGGKIDPSKDFEFLYETNDPNREINYMSGWLLVARKSVWQKLEYQQGKIFNDTFFCYYEDADLSFRGSKLEIKFYIVPVPVVHFGKVSSKQLNTFALYNESRQKFLNIWKIK